MSLDETQRKKVADWIAQGLKLSDIQNRISSEFGIRLTYMDVRLLVDDLKLVPKDAEPPKTSSALTTGVPSPQPAPVTGSRQPPATDSPIPQKPGGVSVSVDQLARPGALVSGKVTFSDGNNAQWYIDQTGRLGLVPQQPGYRPPPADLQQFQSALDGELSKMGF